MDYVEGWDLNGYPLDLCIPVSKWNDSSVKKMFFYLNYGLYEYRIINQKIRIKQGCWKAKEWTNHCLCKGHATLAI